VKCELGNANIRFNCCVCIYFFVCGNSSYIQAKGFEKSRKLQLILTIFKELQNQDLFNERRYIYENFPENIEGIESNQLKAHIQKAETAIIAFDRLGYLAHQGHVDVVPIMENHWSSIWRYWEKSKNLINWAREQRGELKYCEYFEYLFGLSETYRIENELQKPKIY